MTEIIAARFKSGGKSYYFSPNGLTFQPGQGVVVETSRGVELGECVEGNRMVDETELLAPLRPVIRAATPEDYKTAERNREKEEKAFAVCQEKIIQHGLDMKLVEAECSFEGNKILFLFTSEGRVDFRALVKDLAGALHARIELRQIGVRDEAKTLGGLGICGRPFCCSQFLDEFQPVSIKMAKTQNLSLNPTKISGTCGRLMCCLKYEQDAYEDLVKHAPKAESFVETPDGVGTVCNVNLLRQKVNVRLEDDPETPRCYHNCEICVVRSGKGKRPEGYVAPPPEELAKRRRVADPEEVPAPPADPMGAALAKVLDKGEEEAAPQQGQERSGRNRRRRGGSGEHGEKKPTAAPAPANEGEKAPEQEGGEKKRSRHRHRHRRRPGSKSEGGQAPQQ
ncbi:MAG: stage 0 sporulation family protein [Oscillospiraceae bacterium]|nr:stage 0 sporulation family protein [Oscillospiraceae bacterium]